VLETGDVRDAFVVKKGSKYQSIDELPTGSVVGTSSIRRTAQILARYPHLKVDDMRGNVPTRLRKLDAEDSPFAALIVAAAGLLRLDMGDRITQYLDSKQGMLHAVGQGTVGIENRSSDKNVQRMLGQINHKRSFFATTAERSLLRTIEGGCSAPLGVETEWSTEDSGDLLRLKAVVVSTDGKKVVEIEIQEQVQDKEAAERLGSDAADQLLRKGADTILAEIKAKRPTTITDLEET
jgi:hydroxymethylbilane synthase